MEAKQVVEIRKLEEQLAAVRENARTAFLASANEALSQLKAIGFEYELVERGASERKCGNCGGVGHTARNCPKGGANGKGDGNEKHPTQ